MRTAEVEDLLDEPRPPSPLGRWLLALLALAMVAGVVALAVVTRTDPDALAELRVRDPQVTVSRDGKAAEAAEGADLLAGDGIATDGSGRAQIDFFDGSIIRLDTDTAVTLRTLEGAEGANTIRVALGKGRLWNRIDELAADDSYSLDVGAAAVTVRGTTFLADCRTGDVCYVVGFEGESEVEADSGGQMEVGSGDCVAIDAAGTLDECNEKKLDLLDDWVRENLAEDQQLEVDRIDVPSGAPTPEATVTAPRRRTFAPAAPRRDAPPPAPAGTRPPVRTDPPRVTPEPKETKEPPPRTAPPRTSRPRGTPRPTPF